jgi:hypothetical protein
MENCGGPYGGGEWRKGEGEIAPRWRKDWENGKEAENNLVKKNRAPRENWIGEFRCLLRSCPDFLYYHLLELGPKEREGL